MSSSIAFNARPVVFGQDTETSSFKATSLSGRLWLRRPFSSRDALALSQRLDLPIVLGELCAMRGVSLADGPGYLAPTLKALMPDPSCVRDMEKGADRLAQAILRGDKIGVISDYDVDGMSSAALFVRFLKATGTPWEVYFPDRLNEGYGPSTGGVETLLGAGASLLVTLDCGISAHDVVDYARARGAEVMIVDHHRATPTLPNAQVVINPNRLDDTSGLGMLCAAGVTFFLIATTLRVLKEKGRTITPSPLAWLDLVALATVCDVVPLVGLNRAYVQQGLKIMAQRRTPGLVALADGAGIRRPIDAGLLGYVLGPRLNAAGRVGEPRLGFDLLVTDDLGVARERALQLESLNRVRQTIEATVLAEALAQAEAQEYHKGPQSATVVCGENWHPGVVGLIAARLVERYAKPAVVLTGSARSSTVSGSARSVSGVDLAALVHELQQKGYLVKGGGHAMAAGMTVHREALDPFQAHICAFCANAMAERGPETLLWDGVLTASGVHLPFIESLEQIGPFGSANPTPTFIFPNHRVVYSTIVGTDHVQCTVEGQGTRIKAMAFRAGQTPLGERLLSDQGAPLHIAARLNINDWNGRRTPQLLIQDVANPF